jgi:hypothetical protein
LEIGLILDLAEIGTGEQFLGGDDLGPPAGGIADHFLGVAKVTLAIQGTGVLDQAQADDGIAARRLEITGFHDTALDGAVRRSIIVTDRGTGR